MSNNSDGVFESYSNYYNLLYTDKDYIGETDYVCALLERYGAPSGSILELGSGTGIHGRLLAGKGYRVHGIERSAEMVSNAELVEGFTCEQGDIRSIAVADTYNVVISLFHVISYLTTNEDVNSAFEGAAKSLNTGGLFVFDFWYSPAVYQEKPSVRIKRMSNEDISVVRIAEPESKDEENIIDVKFSIAVEDLKSSTHSHFSEIHPMRHFSIPEMELFASIHGFELIGREEFLSGAKLDSSTWAATVVLKKK